MGSGSKTIGLGICGHPVKLCLPHVEDLKKKIEMPHKHIRAAKQRITCKKPIHHASTARHAEAYMQLYSESVQLDYRTHALTQCNHARHKFLQITTVSELTAVATHAT